jgi:hypothetical protein
MGSIPEPGTTVPDTFTVTVAHQPAQTVVAVAGEMDLATCPRSPRRPPGTASPTSGCGW